jgi:predicted DNA binding CopG/RHH family protein
MKKQIPRLTTDEEAAQFVKTANLSEYDLSDFKPATFEFQNKAAQLNMRVPEPLLDAVKQRAKAQGIPYTRFIRQLMEQAVSKPQRG